MNTPQTTRIGSLIIAAFVLCIVSLSSAYAQPKGAQPPSTDERIAMMKKHLSISDDQASKIKPILENQQTVMAKIREENKGKRDEMIKAAQTREDAFEKEMAAVLTPEQNQKWLKGREKAIDTMKKRADKAK